MAGLSSEYYKIMFGSGNPHAAHVAANPKLITRFNAGHRRMLDRYLTAFLKDLYSTAPADEKFVEQNIREAYYLAGLGDQSAEVVWCDSPHELLIKARQYRDEQRRKAQEALTRTRPAPSSDMGFRQAYLGQFVDRAARGDDISATYQIPIPQNNPHGGTLTMNQAYYVGRDGREVRLGDVPRTQNDHEAHERAALWANSQMASLGDWRPPDPPTYRFETIVTVNAEQGVQYTAVRERTTGRAITVSQPIGAPPLSPDERAYLELELTRQAQTFGRNRDGVTYHVSNAAYPDEFEESIRDVLVDKLQNHSKQLSLAQCSEAVVEKVEFEIVAQLRPTFNSVGFAFQAALDRDARGFFADQLTSWHERLAHLVFSGFLSERLTLECAASAVPLLNILRSASCFVPYRDLCFVCRRPERIELDQNGLLHDNKQAAMRWSDGWGIYALRGSSVDSKAVEHPEQLTMMDVRMAGRPAARRAVLEQYGEVRYIQHFYAAERLQPMQDEAGWLYHIDWHYDEPLVYFKCQNTTPGPDGTYETFWIRVPPDIKTPKEAKAWTFGRGTDDFNLDDES